MKIAEIQRLAAASQQAEREMLYAGIFSPDFGQREDIPSIILPDGFTSESENILLRYGLLERVRMKLGEMIETAFANGTITATNGSPTITASGGAGTWSTSATHKPYWTGRKITITDDGVDTEYTISTVNDAGDQITLTGNYTGTGGAGLAYSIGTAGQKVVSPDANPFIHYEQLIQTAGGAETEYEMGFTKAHAYLWSVPWSAWILKFTCSSDCTFWDSDTFNNQIISTNNVDKIQVWGDTIGNAFANLTGDAGGIPIGGGQYITKAKYVKVCQNYVHLAGIEEGGSSCPNDDAWCSYNDETDWDRTGTGDANKTTVEGPGFINGLGVYGNDLVVGKKGCCKLLRLVTSSDVWVQDVLLEKSGLLAAHSFVTDKEGRAYFIDDSYCVRRLPGADIVSEAKDVTFKNINPALQDYIKSIYIREYNKIYWSIPYGGDATGNNKIVWFDPNKLTFGDIDIAAAAFGRYSRQTVYTWGTLPFASWSAWDWEKWSATDNIVGFKLDLCSDYSGNTFTLNSADLDDGSTYEGYFVLALDLLAQKIAKRYGISMRHFKKIYHFQLWMKNEGAGTVSIYTKSDGETSWQLCGSGSLNGTNDLIPVDIYSENGIRARLHELKISGQNRFTFYGILIGFTPDGTK